MKHTNKWLAIFVILAVICLCGCSASKTLDKPEETTEETLLSQENSKQPEDYTWEEYVALTDQEKAVFIASFESPEAFEQWKSCVTGTSEEETMPWETDGKQPKEYTWAEYEALTVSQKEAFYDSFGSSVEFDNWMSRATGASEVETMPWEAGGKQPKEYTWAEYEALTASQREAFYDSFGSSVEFDNWVSHVTGTSAVETMPWEAGGKQPQEYTWAEYEALTAQQKEAFFESFESTDDFDNWMNRVSGNTGTSESGKLPWEAGGKQPKDYTWAEYEALTVLQKEEFFESFDDVNDFESWLAANQK